MSTSDHYYTSANTVLSFKYFTIKQQWHSESRFYAKKSRLKEVRSRNKSAHQIIVGYVGAVYTSILLGNHPVPVKLQRVFF